MNTTAGQISTSWYEVDELITMLRAWGIEYLVGLEPVAHAPRIEKDSLPPIVFLQRLAQCDDYPRVRDAIISLLLLHPELAEAVQQAIHESDPPVAKRIAVLILATLYLQRLWSIRLAIAFGHPSTFPEQSFASLWQDRHLPSPACHEGACGLLALEEAEQKRTGLPFTFTGDWQNQIKHLLWQEEMQRRHKKISLATLASLLSKEEQSYEPELDMVCGVGKANFEDFIKQLGFADCYSIALSKIERGTTRDIADVKLLVQQGIITLDELDQAYQEVLAQLGNGRYPRVTPQRFTRRYLDVRGLLS